MKSKKRYYEPTYNCQTAVEKGKGVIIAAQAFPEPTDVNLLPEVVEKQLKLIGHQG